MPQIHPSHIPNFMFLLFPAQLCATNILLICILHWSQFYPSRPTFNTENRFYISQLPIISQLEMVLHVLFIFYQLTLTYMCNSVNICQRFSYNTLGLKRFSKKTLTSWLQRATITCNDHMHIWNYKFKYNVWLCKPNIPAREKD